MQIVKTDFNISQIIDPREIIARSDTGASMTIPANTLQELAIINPRALGDYVDLVLMSMCINDRDEELWRECLIDGEDPTVGYADIFYQLLDHYIDDYVCGNYHFDMAEKTITDMYHYLPVATLLYDAIVKHVSTRGPSPYFYVKNYDVRERCNPNPVMHCPIYVITMECSCFSVVRHPASVYDL